MSRPIVTLLTLNPANTLNPDDILNPANTLNPDDSLERERYSNFTSYFSEVIDPSVSNIKNSNDLAENLSLTACLYYLISDCVRSQKDNFFTVGIRAFFPSEIVDSPVLYYFTFFFLPDNSEYLPTQIKLNMKRMVYNSFYLAFNIPFKIEIYACSLLNDEIKEGKKKKKKLIH